MKILEKVDSLKFFQLVNSIVGRIVGGGSDIGRGRWGGGSGVGKTSGQVGRNLKKLHIYGLKHEFR